MQRDGERLDGSGGLLRVLHRVSSWASLSIWNTTFSLCDAPGDTLHSHSATFIFSNYMLSNSVHSLQGEGISPLFESTEIYLEIERYQMYIANIIKQRPGEVSRAALRSLSPHSTQKLLQKKILWINM